MSYRIAISFAAATIGSCIATEAIAQAPAGFGSVAAPQLQQLDASWARAPAGFGGAAAPQAPVGAAGGYYYAPASDNGNTACGRFPFPPCKKVTD
jgi:hypothetical protein